MTPREDFARRRRLMRTLCAATRLQCGTAARLALLATVAEAAPDLRDVMRTNDTLAGGAAWTVGMVPRQVAGYEGDNFARALRSRQLDRILRRPTYQPGPARGALP